MKNQKNQGFTLVELIVVIALMGVALTVGGYSLNAISLSRAKNCASEIYYGLERTRTQSYSSDGGAYGTATLEIYRENNNVYMKKSYEGSAEKIGNSSVSVTYMIKGEAAARTLGSDHVIFSFNKSSGAYKSTMVGSETAGECTSIIVTGGGKTYTITCYSKTGRTTME